ncbi:MAG: hypothetical protein BWY09_02039 [Candidatus Hydrogenedentes bacterium ADurb.Bin179]|nr:MAG: hypothetical protein BWY09_02039 [Candidatus Hydrogenedentes bacterium ADurb.Bin179]
MKPKSIADTKTTPTPSLVTRLQANARGKVRAQGNLPAMKAADIAAVRTATKHQR